MPAIPYACFAPVDPQGRARRNALQKRMRLASALAAAAVAILAGAVAQAYIQGGALPAAGILVAGLLFLFEAFRRADRTYLAPLQAACQDDYSRQIDLLLRPLLDDAGAAAVDRTRRSGA
jgi:hypothetical protein